MIRAVLDTNVIVSSLLKPTSVPAQIRKAWRDRSFELCLSKALFLELVDVMDRPKIAKATRISKEEIDAFLRLLPKGADFYLESLPRIEVISKDPDDNIVLATAIATNASVIVSGDRHLLEIGAYEGIRIVTPHSFLEMLGVRGAS